jgi:hypothetical protein
MRLHVSVERTASPLGQQPHNHPSSQCLDSHPYNLLMASVCRSNRTKCMPRRQNQLRQRATFA